MKSARVLLLRLAGALVLVALFALVGGIAHVRNAAAFSGGSLTITLPNNRGVASGPPDTSLQVTGGGWLPYSAITLSLAPAGSSCGGVSVGSFPTDQGGGFTAGFDWPTTVNRVGTYYVCGTQADNGSALSTNTFSLLASSPPALTFSPSSLVAGETLTITGANWVPGPQTLNVVVVPCKSFCTDAPVAQQTIVTKSNGTFTLPLMISAGTPTGQYYIQATNPSATLASISAAPVQVSSQAASVGTPVPGVSPTTTSTRTSQAGSTLSTPSPLSQASGALKNALLAAVAALVVLLALIGALAFFIGRSRGPDLPARARAPNQNDPPRVHPGMPSPPQRDASPALAASHPPDRALALQGSYQRQNDPADQRGQTPPDAAEPDQNPENAPSDAWPSDNPTRGVPPHRYQRGEPFAGQ